MGEESPPERLQRLANIDARPHQVLYNEKLF
jgi:hypothetical protein